MSVNWNLWHQLGTPSRRAIRRSRTRFGHPYSYRPRGNLIERLAQSNGLTKEEVYRELMRLHEALRDAGS